MKIDLGHDNWSLAIISPEGREVHDRVSLSVKPIEDEDKEAFWGEKPNTEPALTARQIEDSSFVGRISLASLFLTESGFDAEGFALEEGGTMLLEGIRKIQRWQAERRY